MLAVTILLGAVAAGTLAYLHFQLSDVGTISTPPPEVASNRLGGTNESPSTRVQPKMQCAKRNEKKRRNGPCILTRATSPKILQMVFQLAVLRLRNSIVITNNRQTPACPR